jgi:hypothetical protein
MKKKDIISSIDKIMNDNSIEDKIFDLNSLKGCLKIKREFGYFYARVRYYFGDTPAHFKSQEEYLKFFDQENFYDELIAREKQRNTPHRPKIK